LPATVLFSHFKIL